MRPEILEPYFPTNHQKLAVVLGAHEGRWVKRVVHLFERVVAVEPNPASVRTLQTTEFEKLVQVVDAAAWITDGQVMNFHVRQGIDSALECRDLLRTEGVTETIKVSTISVDGINLDACDLIICDVEGAEIQALMGATATIENFKPDLMISCHEIEHRNWLSTWLERCGYNVAIVHDSEREVGDDWQRNVWMVAQHYRFRGAL